MRNITIILIALLSFKMSAQDLPTICLNKDVTTHFISDVFMDKIDLSTNLVVGELSNEKILAIKPISDENLELGVLSITGQDFFTQYQCTKQSHFQVAGERHRSGS